MPAAIPKFATGLFAMLVLCLSTSSAVAEEAANEWSFVIAPYAWLAGTGGTIITDAEETDFDLSFEEILDATSGGFQLTAGARYGRFFLGFDGTKARLGHGEYLLGGRIDFKINQSIAELHGGYRIFGPEFRPANVESDRFQHSEVILDAYFGVRYWRTELRLNIDLPGLPPIIPPTQKSSSSRDQWVEPLIGGRLGVSLSPNVGLMVDGNLGGFGIGDAADLTWTLSAFINWQFGHHWSAAFGWRSQGVDDVSGSGDERNGSEILTTGPVIGVLYTF